MKKAFLIVPPTGLWVREDRCQSPIAKTMFSVIRPPLRLGLAATILEEASYKCLIADYPAENKGWEDFKQDLNEFNPNILLISTVFKTRNKDFQACRLAKNYNKNILTIMKGAPLGDDIGALEECTELDIFMTREIDRSLISIGSRKNLSQVSGIIFRKNGRIIKSPPAPFIKNLDSLPFIARHLLKNNLYCRPDTMEPLTVIQASRGCPYKCIFCSAILGAGQKLRKRSPKNIVDEMEECVREFGLLNFFLGAETFTCDKEWVLDICKEIIKKNLKVSWTCNSRADTIDREMAIQMKQSGCFAISVGIESGNQETLDRMKKGITLSQSINAIKLLKDVKIKTYLYYVIGFPWETKEMIKETINFALKLNGDISDFYLAQPLYGTQLYKMAKEENMLEEGDNFLFGYRINSPNVSPEKLDKLYHSALLRFYLRPSYILKTLAGIRSLKVAYRIAILGFTTIFSLLKSKTSV